MDIICEDVVVLPSTSSSPSLPLPKITEKLWNWSQKSEILSGQLEEVQKS